MINNSLYLTNKDGPSVIITTPSVPSIPSTTKNTSNTKSKDILKNILEGTQPEVTKVQDTAISKIPTRVFVKEIKDNIVIDTVWNPLNIMETIPQIDPERKTGKDAIETIIINNPDEFSKSIDFLITPENIDFFSKLLSRDFLQDERNNKKEFDAIYKLLSVNAIQPNNNVIELAKDNYDDLKNIIDIISETVVPDIILDHNIIRTIYVNSGRMSYKDKSNLDSELERLLNMSFKYIKSDLKVFDSLDSIVEFFNSEVSSDDEDNLLYFFVRLNEKSSYAEKNIPLTSLLLNVKNIDSKDTIPNISKYSFKESSILDYTYINKLKGITNDNILNKYKDLNKFLLTFASFIANGTINY